MAGESSSAQPNVEEQHQPEPLPQTTEEKILRIQRHIISEPVANLSTYGYGGLDEMYATIRAADGFFKIITHEPKF